MFVVMCQNNQGQIWTECTLALADWPRWREQRMYKAALKRHRVIERMRTRIVVDSAQDTLTYTLEYVPVWRDS